MGRERGPRRRLEFRCLLVLLRVSCRRAGSWPPDAVADRDERSRYEDGADEEGVEEHADGDRGADFGDGDGWQLTAGSRARGTRRS